MTQLFLIIIIILLVIVLLLLRYILFENTPSEVKIEQPKEVKHKPHKKQPSIVGASTNVRYEAKAKQTTSKSRKSATVPNEDLEQVFTNELYDDRDIDLGYDDEKEELSQKELEDEGAISTNSEAQVDELEKEQQKRCIDYFQIKSVSRALNRGEELSEDNINTMRKLKGTNLMSNIVDQMNTIHTQRVSDMLDSLEPF